jgi:hypothetical protein
MRLRLLCPLRGGIERGSREAAAPVGRGPESAHRRCVPFDSPERETDRQFVLDQIRKMLHSD